MSPFEQLMKKISQKTPVVRMSSSNQPPLYMNSFDEAFYAKLDYFTVSDWQSYIRILVRRLRHETDEHQRRLILERLEKSMM